MKEIPHSRPTVDTKDIQAVKAAMQSSWLSADKQCLFFEKKLAKYFGLKHASVVNSGTSALHLSLLALGIEKGDEVMLPSFVCTALANAVKYVGARVRLVDVNEHDYNISYKDVKRKLVPKTRAIIVPHMFGCPADLKELTSLGVPVIEDCAQAIGAVYHKKKVGCFGKIAIGSFYATKMMTTGEGGVVLSNNAALMRTVNDLKSYDHRKDYRVRYNYKMTDFQAALGLSQLGKLSQFIQKRRAIASVYTKQLSQCPVALPKEQDLKKQVYFRYVIRLSKKRDEFLKHMAKRGIICARPLFKPLHHYLGHKGFAVTDKLFREAVSLPVYPSLGLDQVKKIAKEASRYWT